MLRIICISVNVYAQVGIHFTVMGGGAYPSRHSVRGGAHPGQSLQCHHMETGSFHTHDEPVLCPSSSPAEIGGVFQPACSRVSPSSAASYQTLIQSHHCHTFFL